MRDGYGREIDYLRISVTDKCNLRCRYCMPEDIEAVPMSEILTFEEIIETVKAASGLGIRKLKITGGEPLVRRNICNLIRMLKEVNGIEQITLTTNGILLSENIDKLIKAGIDGINVSLDTLDRKRYKRLTGFDELDRVLKGISAVLETRIPVKLNAVSIDWGAFSDKMNPEEKTPDSFGAGYSPDMLEDSFSLVEYARDKAIDIRFIELMPIGYGKDFPGIPHDTLIPAVKDRYSGMIRDEVKHGNGPAVYYRIPGYKGSVGFISALHGMFCENCNRIRLTTKGYLKNCLCYDTGADIKEILRSGLPDTERRERLGSVMEEVISGKPGSHCFISEENISEKSPMSSIGG
jgi:cyclic pyranopterin phosphate synthase